MTQIPITVEPIVVLLYLLMRDDLPAGRLERLVCELEQDRKFGSDGWKLSNGYLTGYAEELAERIRQVVAPGSPRHNEAKVTHA